MSISNFPTFLALFPVVSGFSIFQPIPRPFLLNSRLFLELSSYRPDFWSVYLGACSLQCLSFFSGPKFQVCFATQFPFSFLPLPITTLEFRWVSLGLAQLLFGLDWLGTLFRSVFIFLDIFTCRKHIICCVSLKVVLLGSRWTITPTPLVFLF